MMERGQIGFLRNTTAVGLSLTLALSLLIFPLFDSRAVSHIVRRIVQSEKGGEGGRGSEASRRLSVLHGA